MNAVPTLARGMAKRLVRDLDEQRSLEWQPYHKNSRRGWFKHHRAMALKTVGTAYLGENFHYPATEIFYVVPSSFPGRMGVQSITIDAKRFIRELYDISTFVTRHCIERVFQRLGSNQEECLQELMSAIHDSGLVTEPGDFNIKTQGGLFIATHDKTATTLVTFIDNDKLRPEQAVPPATDECRQTGEMK